MKYFTIAFIISLAFCIHKGSALNCYNCQGIDGECILTLECPSGFDACYSTDEVNGLREFSCGFIQMCDEGSSGVASIDLVRDQLLAQGYTLTCCQTDLCNKDADGGVGSTRPISAIFLLVSAFLPLLVFNHFF